MVSDNRDVGNDSYVYGPVSYLQKLKKILLLVKTNQLLIPKIQFKVSRGLIEAKCVAIIWPPDRIKKL